MMLEVGSDRKPLKTAIMIYCVVLSMMALCMVFACAACRQELSRLDSLLEMEKTKHQVQVDVQKAKNEGSATQRAAIAESLACSQKDLLAADQNLIAQSSGATPSIFLQVHKLLGIVQDQMTDLSSPKRKKDDSLDNNLRNLFEYLSGADLQISVDVSTGDRRYPRQKEILIIQACSELVQNAIKHSNATQCEVSLHQEGADLRLRVKDNGHNDVTATKLGFGLSRLQTRTNRQGGSFSFRLGKDGAEAIMTLPLVTQGMLVMV